MRKTLFALCACIAILCAFILTPITASATAAELEKPSSLTIIYNDGDVAFSGLTVKTYRIADVSEDGNYTLCGDFKNYPVSLYDVRSQAEWQSIASTLASYAIADNIMPTVMQATDESGTVKYEGLYPGMYLTLSVKNESAEQITVFENFLTAIPMPAGDGTYNYDVTVYPKNTKYTPTIEEISHKVIKQWKDGGCENKRPSEVRVDIYKDGELKETVTLSDQNNWMYEWTAADDGSKWSAVERDIPADYKVTVTEQGNTIVLTNIYFDGDIDSPQTGDTSNIELYIAIMCISGFMIILLSLWRKRSEA